MMHGSQEVSRVFTYLDYYVFTQYLGTFNIRVLQSAVLFSPTGECRFQSSAKVSS